MLTIAEGLASRGWSITLITLHPPVDYPVPPSVDHWQLAKSENVRDKRLAAELSTRYAQLREQGLQPDLVLVNLVRSSRVAHLVDFGATPVYFTLRNPLAAQTQATKDPIRGWVARRRLRKLYEGQKIIGISAGVVDDLVRKIGARPQASHVIPNPFDIDNIRREAKARNETMIRLQPFVVCVGHFKRQKRQDLALRAWEQSGIETNLVFIGSGSTKKKQDILDQAYRIGVADRVFVMDWQPNVYSWIAAADLILVTSDFEGFGRVIVEALAVNTPVVSTDCPSGPREILTGELAAGLAPMGDVDAVSSKIHDIFCHPPKILESHIAPFRIEYILDAYEDLVHDSK